MDLFVYGTLMVPTIMHRVSGYARPGRTALLPGYRRRMISGELYPGIVPDPAETVEGTLYRDLALRQLQRLDRFEGAQYQRETVEIIDGGVAGIAQAYVLRPQWRHSLTDRHWELAAFLSTGMARFSAEYDGFGAVESSNRGEHD